MNQLTIHHDCPGWGENDRRLLERRMQSGCADDDLRGYNENCSNDSQCATNFCRFNKCRCRNNSMQTSCADDDLCNVNDDCPYDKPSCDGNSGRCFSYRNEVCRSAGLSSCQRPSSQEEDYRCSKIDGETNLKCRIRNGGPCTEWSECSSRCCKKDNNNDILGICRREDMCDAGTYQFSLECTNSDDCEKYHPGLLCKQCGNGANKCARPNGRECTEWSQWASDCCKGPSGSKTCRNRSECSGSCLNNPN